MTPATIERLKAASITARNAAIRQAKAEGASLREIGALVEMTHAGVRKILAKAVAVILVAVAAMVVLPAARTEADVACRHTAIIGDSLTARGNGALHAQFPKATINARGGRTTVDAYEAAVGVAESVPVNCWVFALGTNDVLQGLNRLDVRDGIAHLMTLVRPTDHVWWIVPNVRGAAWYTALIPASVATVNTYPAPADYLRDHIHLTGAGYVHRATAISAAIAA